MVRKGPTPKHNSGRLAKNVERINEEITQYGEVTVPRAQPGWNKLASQWYSALKSSGQSQYYEPSDWLSAVLAAELLSNYLDAEPGDRKPSNLASFLRLSASLGATFTDRLHSKLEVKRERRPPPVPDERELRNRFN